MIQRAYNKWCFQFYDDVEPVPCEIYQESANYPGFFFVHVGLPSARPQIVSFRRVFDTRDQALMASRFSIRYIDNQRTMAGAIHDLKEYEMSKAKTSGDRHNGFGPVPSSQGRSLSAALDLTRRHVAAQGPAAFAFSDQWTTPQWECVKGHANPTTRDKCRFCGEPRTVTP